jgi:hypothetical protein
MVEKIQLTRPPYFTLNFSGLHFPFSMQLVKVASAIEKCHILSGIASASQPNIKSIS